MGCRTPDLEFFGVSGHPRHPEWLRHCWAVENKTSACYWTPVSQSNHQQRNISRQQHWNINRQDRRSTVASSAIKGIEVGGQVATIVLTTLPNIAGVYWLAWVRQQLAGYVRRTGGRRHVGAETRRTIISDRLGDLTQSSAFCAARSAVRMWVI